MSDSVRGLCEQYLKDVKKSGPDNIMAICPFHRKADGTEEKNGSFALNIRNGLWYCFSCHERGNLWTFLKMMGVSRVQAETLYGYILNTLETTEGPRDPLRPINAADTPLEESFLGLFDGVPQTLVDTDAESGEPGFPPELLRKYDIGVDAKHERITFPIRDWRGKLVGISGRALHPWQKPRYKVYTREYIEWGVPARELDKRCIIWNAHNVFAQLQHEKDPELRYVVVVEGFKACLRLIQHGFTNTVALLGSYMSDEQKQLIQRMGCEVYLMLDNDEAGIDGSISMGRLLMESMTVRYVDYPAAQPSTLDKSAIEDAIIRAENFSVWYAKQLAQATQFSQT